MPEGVYSALPENGHPVGNGALDIGHPLRHK
jgi:hypothetical protein